ncbi:MAG: glycosyltransferase family 9 protein [Caulobacteraceae bacterium]|nr:glycosyltransferase family 9 protein [Caulobacteraceae bacterium]
MRGRYLIRNPYVAAAFTGVDLCLDALPRRQVNMPGAPRRILICNWAHLGDVLLTLPAVAWLKARYPDAAFGFLAGSWAAPILEDMKDQFAQIHLIDHFILSKAGSVSDRLRQQRRTARSAIRQMRSANYDLAVDLYPFFPGAGFTLWRAGVPVRVGWTSGGLGAFYTHRVRRIDQDRHVIDYHRDILSKVAPENPPAPGSLRPIYFRGRAITPLPSPLDDGRPYVLMHTGTRQQSREWADEKWTELARRLVAQSKRVVLLGSGDREAARNRAIAAAVPGAIDLTGAFSWAGLVDVVERCEALFCLESVASHIAAVFDRPTTVVYSGTTNPKQWGPLARRASIVTSPTPCAPCNRLGCESMYCIAGVEVDHMVAAAAHVAGAA